MKFVVKLFDFKSLQISSVFRIYVKYLKLVEFVLLDIFQFPLLTLEFLFHLAAFFKGFSFREFVDLLFLLNLASKIKKIKKFIKN